MQKRKHTQSCNGKGFTLIELLVVISIIAVLLSILLPTLEKTQRQVKVMQCSANLKSYALGLIVYATEDAQGIFPPTTVSGWGHALTIWATDGGGIISGTFPDKHRYLAMFRDIICGGNWRILWCPFDTYYYNPLSDLGKAFVSNGLTDGQYTYLWYDNRWGAEKYMAGYYRFANLANAPFTNSGNSNTSGPPLGPGSSQDAIVADKINSNGPPSPPEQFYQSPHMEWPSVYAHEAVLKRRDNNVAYSDGHVETHAGGYIGADGYFTWEGAHWVGHGSSPWRLQY